MDEHVFNNKRNQGILTKLQENDSLDGNDIRQMDHVGTLLNHRAKNEAEKQAAQQFQELSRSAMVENQYRNAEKQDSQFKLFGQLVDEPHAKGLIEKNILHVIDNNHPISSIQAQKHLDEVKSQQKPELLDLEEKERSLAALPPGSADTNRYNGYTFINEGVDRNNDKKSIETKAFIDNRDKSKDNIAKSIEELKNTSLRNANNLIDRLPDLEKKSGSSSNTKPIRLQDIRVTLPIPGIAKEQEPYIKSHYGDIDAFLLYNHYFHGDGQPVEIPSSKLKTSINLMQNDKFMEQINALAKEGPHEIKNKIFEININADSNFHERATIGKQDIFIKGDLKINQEGTFEMKNIQYKPKDGYFDFERRQNRSPVNELYTTLLRKTPGTDFMIQWNGWGTLEDIPHRPINK